MTELIYVVNDELKNKLTHHKGIIPIYLIPLIDRREYDNNLKKHGIYEEVYEEYNQIRLNRKRSKDKEKFGNAFACFNIYTANFYSGFNSFSSATIK